MKTLQALSPIDGRYSDKVDLLRRYLSESALITFRYHVECDYLFFLLETLEIPFLPKLVKKLRKCNPRKIKIIEKTTKHDVKAVEIYLRNKILRFDPTLNRIANLVHFGLTSEDVNNVAYKQMLQYTNTAMRHKYGHAMMELGDLAKRYPDTIMLAKTHGQLAYPVCFSKQMQVFVDRINYEDSTMRGIMAFPSCKFGGAVGTLLDHSVALPDYDWEELFRVFLIQNFGMHRQCCTTQIENYTDMCAYLDSCKRMANILRDLCQDMWLYISYDYLKLKVVQTETGSSVMAHKINPIHFENAIGNFKMASSQFEVLSRELPVSMLQRDLTSSTMLRCLGEAFGHLLIGVESCIEGLTRIDLNVEKLNDDIVNNWQVFSGVYQNVLRIRCPELADPYTLFKDFTRDGRPKTREQMMQFITTLPISEEDGKYLRDLDLLSNFKFDNKSHFEYMDQMYDFGSENL